MTKDDDTALMMLTSGSTGPSKAVCLSHRQIMASLAGKCSMLPVKPETAFLNWIRLDHVGSLVEIHLHALFIAADQVHVQSEDFISDPSTFLALIERHRVSRTFAPNFFLSQLNQTLGSHNSKGFNLSALQYIVSGGEANYVASCSRLSRLLEGYGAPSNVIVPGFGMTETCAGSIYSLSFPSHDIKQSYELATVGYCVPGVEMRIAAPNGTVVYPGLTGDLQLKGPIVFSKYHNDASATRDAFTVDGWFKTGDTAFADASSRIVLTGRTKEDISINGIKYQPQNLETEIEEAKIPGVLQGSLACFSHHPSGAQPERVCVVYVPSYAAEDIKARYDTSNAIVQKVVFITNNRPIVIPLQSIERTSLGKVSRSSIKKTWQDGQYRTEQMKNEKMIAQYQSSIYSPPRTDLETTIQKSVTDVLELSPGSVGVDTNIFELGLTSITLIKLQRSLQKQLKNGNEVPIVTIITYPTVRSLSIALQESTAYMPVVPLQTHGDKAPLWFIHPAAGEALVFLNLSKLITDRPVYSFRARGFLPGEKYFSSLEECISIYHSELKRKQPEGPYLIVGYSYGSMLAFEIGKVLEQNGDEVRFLASVNRPPYVHPRLQQVQWSDCLLNLAYFVKVISQEVFGQLLTDLQGVSKEETISRVMESAHSARLSELALDGKKLENWANVTLSLQDVARKYQPQGSVNNMDVFYCDPLEMVGATKEQWLKRLESWQDFSRSKTNYYGLRGKHHEVFGQEHVQSMYKSFKEAMALRGVN
ncbi:thioesterase domain protein [Penicillium angulare]|uniref:Thioesterase domain protein n=1 Tax=Penicillium angulare TaxID=116970 RepID=A0A9W9KQI4_9EURO|nr:thioesterase domain protein [Penicillium angulare]